MMSERPQWSAARRVPDRKGHGDVSQTSFGVSRTHAKVRPIARPHERLSGAPLPLLRETKKEAPPGAPKGRKSDPRNQRSVGCLTSESEICAVGWANSPAAALMVGNGTRANLPAMCAEVMRRCPPYTR